MALQALLEGLLTSKESTYFNISFSPCLLTIDQSSKVFWSPVVCRQSVRLYFFMFVIFPYLHVLLQNHWAIFNQNWYKASLGEVSPSLNKWRGGSIPLPKWDNFDIENIRRWVVLNRTLALFKPHMVQRIYFKKKKQDNHDFNGHLKSTVIFCKKGSYFHSNKPLIK